MPPAAPLLRHLVVLGIAVLGRLATAQSLPAPIENALQQAGLPSDSLALWVAPVDGGPPVLAHQAERPVNPASLMKLATSAVALAQLGPSYRWRTPVLVDHLPQDGRRPGNVYLRGRGDPQLTLERLWLLLRELQRRGVREIDGDIVLDGSAFALSPVDPGAFDGEPFRPYNVQPDALAISHKAVTLQFVPEPALRIARVSAVPALQGWSVPASVPLSAEPSCGDWRQQLQADFSDPAGPRFAGRLPAVCGERSWPVAPPTSLGYNARAVASLWQEIGGRLGGRVRNGMAPAAAQPLFEAVSPTLAEVLRDMNKFSNNLLADQLMLTLALEAQGVGTWDGARERVTAALITQAGCRAEEVTVDRGSGLSRTGRLSARCLGQVLRWAWVNPWMPEFFASLPLAGEDTARRATSVAGRAHLKTGSLDDVAGLAGLVDGPDGQRYTFVAVLQPPPASRGRPLQPVLNDLLGSVLERLPAPR